MPLPLQVIQVMERHHVAPDADTFQQLSEVFQYFPKKPPGYGPEII